MQIFHTTAHRFAGSQRARAALGLLAALAFAPTAQASDSVAESHLVDAAVAYGKAKKEGFASKDLEDFRVALAKARAEAKSTDLKARIERQQGLYYVMTGAGAAGLRSFRLALKQDPKLRLDGEEAATALFECARRMDPKAWDGKALKTAPGGGWVCPGEAVAPAELITATPPSPPKEIKLGWKSIVGGGMVVVGGTLGVWEWSRWSGLSDRLDAANEYAAAHSNEAGHLQPVWDVQDKQKTAKTLGWTGALVAAGGLGMIAWDIFESEDAPAEPAVALSVSPSGALMKVRF